MSLKWCHQPVESEWQLLRGTVVIWISVLHNFSFITQSLSYKCPSEPHWIERLTSSQSKRHTHLAVPFVKDIQVPPKWQEVSLHTGTIVFSAMNRIVRLTFRDIYLSIGLLFRCLNAYCLWVLTIHFAREHTGVLNVWALFNLI
jgi:hypothetical protein